MITNKFERDSSKFDSRLFIGHQVFDKEECTALFMTHLNTPFSGILTLPEANMAGRSAALCIFGILLESGSPSIRERVAAEIFPILMLYGRCNDLPASITEKINAGLPVDEVYDEDVDRVQAAAYCIGGMFTCSLYFIALHFISLHVVNSLSRCHCCL